MDILEIAFWVVFGAFALYALFNALRRGGLKGALFDAQIERTVGEVPLAGVSFGSHFPPRRRWPRTGDRGTPEGPVRQGRGPRPALARGHPP